MLYKIYAQLKASKILASTVQNPDLCPDRVDRNSAWKNIFFFYQQNIFYLLVLTWSTYLVRTYTILKLVFCYTCS